MGAARGSVLTLGGLLLLGACADALRLEPPTDETTSTSSGNGGGNGGDGGASSVGGSAGGGGSEPIGCRSNSDCPAPTAVCDTVKGVCVECLEIEHCSFRPGTLCSEGMCSCPTLTDTWCGPNNCVDTETDPDNCGSCDYVCFGACSAGACVDAWEPTPTENAPSARGHHVAVWTGSQMIVWGGSTNTSGTAALGDGAMYDPSTREWTRMSDVGAPSPRSKATAVWTGSEMIVWGGMGAGGVEFQDGARFDPDQNRWTEVAIQGSTPSARYDHLAVWTGMQMMVVGGESTNQLGDGGVYNPGSNTWETVAQMPNSETRARLAGVWDDVNSKLLIYGGFGDDMTPAAASLPDVYLPDPGGIAPGGRSYSPIWDQLNASGAPTGRSEHTAVYNGTQMLVYGGRDSGGALGTGYIYDIALNSWSLFGGTAPAARYGHTATWMDDTSRMVVFGGLDESNSSLNDGAIFNPMLNSWEAATPFGPMPRSRHTAISTGSQLIVFGGFDGSTALAEGGIYTP